MPWRRKVLIALALMMVGFNHICARLVDFSFLGLNDSMTIGLVQNADDLRSYGAVVTTRFSPGFMFRIEAAGLTMRSSVDDGTGSRYDELIGEAGWSRTFSFSVKGYDAGYDLWAMAGVSLAGNLGFQTIQNTWHEMNSIPEVFLPYCRGASIESLPEGLSGTVTEYTVPGSLVLQSLVRPYHRAADRLFNGLRL